MEKKFAMAITDISEATIIAVILGIFTVIAIAAAGTFGGFWAAITMLIVMLWVANEIYIRVTKNKK